jgi:hypothetical protein
MDDSRGIIYSLFCMFIVQATRDWYYKPTTIVNDDSWVVNKL